MLPVLPLSQSLGQGKHTNCLDGNDLAGILKLQANFWFHVWSEAGSSDSRVLATINRKAKSRCIRRLRRQEEVICCEKLAVAFASINNGKNWRGQALFFSSCYRWFCGCQ